MRHLREVELPSVIDEVLAEPEFKGQRTALNLKPQDLRRRILNPREVDKLLSATNAEISELRHVQRRLGDSEPADLDEAHRVEYGALWEVLALLAQAAFTLCAALLWRAILSGEATALWKLVLFVVVLLGLVVITCCSVVAIVKINNRRPRWEARKVGSAGDLLEHPVSYVLVRLMFVAVAASFIILAWSWLSAEFTILGAILVDFLLIVGVIFQLLAAAAGRTPDERSASERAEAASRRRLREEEAKALGAWRAAARRTVKPVIGQLISTLTTPSYDVNLRIRDDSSLDSMANIDVIVDTTATEQFKRTLRRLRSGAIGVAGPRGAGKTTLLQAYHEGRFLPAGREHLLIRADAPIVYESRDFALHLFAVSCRAVINHRRNFADPGRWTFLWRSRERRAFRRLARLAARNLDTIRYLQTRTVGWSGKLAVAVRLPIDLSVTRSVAKAQQPLTHPEVVHELRAFLARVAETLIAVNPNTAVVPVVVAIDELDKIESAGHAHRFINEIKAIIGVPNCLFVASVSEDALVSYERRGFAVRDAFDSAFDEIIRVDYLSLAETRKLLNGRLIGIPEPFACMCYCLSGGLPRELIRVARTMMGATWVDEDVKLAEVCRSLISKSIVEATTSTQRELAPLGHTTESMPLIRVADGIRLSRQSKPEILAAVRGLATGLNTDPAVARVRLELATFLYYCLTILEVFTNDLDERRIKEAMNDDQVGAFFTIARARQGFSDNVMRSWVLLDQFRRAWELESVSIDPASADSVSQDGV